MRENIPVIRLRSQYGFLAARDGVVLCFFMRRSHHVVASGVWQALQTYRRAIPPQSLAWYVSDDGDFPPLDDKSWEHIRWQILERAGAFACNVELADNPSETGSYRFEYRGLELDTPMFPQPESATTGVAFTFPTEYLLEHGPEHLRTLALEIARELPFITLSEWPETIDTEKKFYPAPYRELALLLEPFLSEESMGWSSVDEERMRRWMRRLCIS